MGNVVMGETLRLLASPVVHSYISAQSAIPAHSYDNTIPVPSDWTWLTTPDVMGHYYSGQNDTSYLNGVQAKVQDGRLFNYFNPRDFALNLWEEGNKRKPDSYAHGYNYHEGDQNRETYKPNTGNPLTDDYFYHFDGALDHLRRMRFPEEPSSQTDDRFEIFARCAQSRSRTVGALSMVQGFISMPLVRYEFNSRHLGHSKEFRSDIVAEKGFWEQAAKDFELHWNVTNQP